MMLSISYPKGCLRKQGLACFGTRLPHLKLHGLLPLRRAGCRISFEKTRAHGESKKVRQSTVDKKGRGFHGAELRHSCHRTSNS